jgi:hypothetical protein
MFLEMDLTDYGTIGLTRQYNVWLLARFICWQVPLYVPMIVVNWQAAPTVLAEQALMASGGGVPPPPAGGRAVGGAVVTGI